MLRRFGILAALLLLSCSGEGRQSEPIALVRNVHALFVGIDAYQFSRSKLPGAQFKDLQGAVGDAQRFKQALAALYGVDVDKASGEACESANDHTVTLINDCATRSRILAALDNKIAALKPGDTLLFYFAGHGAQYRDDEAFDQDSGYNGTILPYDARNPDGSPGDIFDVELKAIKERAVAKGLYFVTIFDSCNSGTATRNGAIGQSRSVPVLEQAAPVEQTPPARDSSVAEAGYWVHLAAAQDGEQAQETPSGAIGERAGVFTTALIETLRMPGMAKASFGDIVGEVGLRVAESGATSQTPSAEGELNASLGAKARDVVLFDATRNGETATLMAGATSGITPGSTFAFFERRADAVAGAKPVATGYVASVEVGTALIKFANPPTRALPERLLAEETRHFFAPRSVVIGIDLPDGAARKAAKQVLDGISFVAAGNPGVARLVPEDDGGVALQAADGTMLADGLGKADSSDFGDRLTHELRKLARVQQLLGLRTGSGEAQGGVAFCVAPEGYRPMNCPALERGGVRKLSMKGRVTATLVNRSGAERYLYLLAIDPRNAVDLVLPSPGEIDRPIAPGQPYRRGPITFDLQGIYRFVTIVSDTPIRADAFQQSGNGTRDITACTSPLERLLCSASEGTRDPGVVAVGNWSASVSSAIVNGGSQ